ncbi:hypothetical protein HK15_12940 [Acetobacter orientalis]|uniref:Uncharacterized protein n=1 Tax=Acetobacter orientalis TaxID=146474 RepID=A0A252B3N6_9PROT|nr:hypothetical protein HK15_12940 [Acetobacter orientalis]
MPAPLYATCHAGARGFACSISREREAGSWFMLALLQKACGGLQKGQSHASPIARFTMLHGSQSSTAWLWLI